MPSSYACCNWTSSLHKDSADVLSIFVSDTSKISTHLDSSLEPPSVYSCVLIIEFTI